jgi:calcineurin-like phosphoesterase family protein
MKITLETGQKLWFTSDTHYGHTNICRGVSNWKDFNGNVPIKQTRDFKTLYHMNDVIIESINSVVGESDILFHLGDWSFGGFENIAEFRNRIVCKNIHLILGNHDHHIENNRDDIQDLFSSVNQYLRLSVSGYEFVLMHYPIASWHNMNTGVIHLHGHVHLPRNKKLAQGKAMDVGVDGNGLMPYSLDEITRIMDKQPIAKLSLPQDHHEEKLSGNGGNKKGSSSF